MGDYVIERELARGGMGVVFAARHVTTGARVALKTLQLSIADPETEARFQREALAQARLRHPAIVRIHTAGVQGATPYLVQDRLEGGSLSGRLRAGPLTVEESLAVVRRVAQGVAHAHAAGVLHRDLKPDNVLFDDRGEACLTDFGLAGFTGGGSRLTATGEIMGTPSCMAPEQASDAKAVDARADVYGLGAILYACLTGRTPFGHVRGGVIQTLHAVLHTPPEPPRALRAGIPEAVEAACLKALAKSPDARFADVSELLAAITPAGPRRDPVAPVWVGLVLVALVGGALIAAQTQGRPPLPSSATEPGEAAAVDPLEQALQRLERGAGLPLELEGRALTRLGSRAELAAVTSRLHALPASQGRENLLALARMRAGALDAVIASRPQARLARRLKALAESLLAAEALYERGGWEVGPLTEQLRRLRLVARPLAQAPGCDEVLADVQRRASRLLAATRVTSGGSEGVVFRPDSDDVQAFVELVEGPAAAELAVAATYAALGQLEDEELLAWAAPPAEGLSELGVYWLLVIEAQRRLRHPWHPASPSLVRRRQALLNQPGGGAGAAFWIADFSVLRAARAYDALYESWVAHRRGDHAGGRALADEACSFLSVSGRGGDAVRLVAELLGAKTGPQGDPYRQSGEEGFRVVYDVEWALARGDLATAQRLLDQELSQPDRVPPEYGLLKMHVGILAGTESAPAVEKALEHARGATEDSMGLYWHLPEHFEDTLEGGWWPGHDAFD